MVRLAGGAKGGKHASSRSHVDEYRRQMGRHQIYTSRAKTKTRHSGKQSVSTHSQKKNWTIIVISLIMLAVLFSAFYAVFAVEMADIIKWVLERFRS